MYQKLWCNFFTNILNVIIILAYQNIKTRFRFSKIKHKKVDFFKKEAEKNIFSFKEKIISCLAW